MTSASTSSATIETGRRVIWVAAAALAISAHVGVGALALWRSAVIDLDDQPAGNIVLELSPILASPSTEQPSTAVGPESTDSVASQPQSLTKPPQLQEQEVPVAQPSPTVPESDLAVPMPVTDAKPVTDQQADVREPEKQSETAAEVSVASQAMAPPKIEAPPAPKSTAPEVGVSPRVERAKATWHQAIAAHLNRFKRFPAEAQSQAAKGDVVVQFSIERSGRVLSASVVKTSGSQSLDTEAIAMLQRAAPLPIPSSDILGESFTMTVPVVFRRR